MLKRFSVVAGLSLASAASAATFSVSGNARFGTNMFNNLDLHKGSLDGAGNTTSFFENRFVLRPDLVIDDRFTVRTEMMLVPTVGGNKLPSRFGTTLGNGAAYGVTKAYLDWASDWGIFSVGRMAKQWGLGVLFDSGDSVFDDEATIVDRASFRALLGNLGLQIAYEKMYEGLVTNARDDADGYEISIDYSNPESLTDIGLLYNRKVAMKDAPAAQGESAHRLSIFGRKRWTALQVGGEFVNVSSSEGGRVGLLGQLDYQTPAWEFGVDVAMGSGSKDTPFSFHPNYRPLLLLFNQTLGPKWGVTSARGGTDGTSAAGSAVGNQDGNGVFLTKIEASYLFESKMLRLGADVGFASLLRQGSNDGSSLGIETDVHLTQTWYDNFKMVYAFGLLMPGTGFGANPTTAWGLQMRGALTF